jgi:protein-S-isoprenylcysteine O-methyltransferase Ste14
LIYRQDLGFIKTNWVINTQKFLIPVLMLGSMIYYDNWSRGCWMYFVLHGSYGTLWVIKDLVNPDKTFQERIPFINAVLCALFLTMYLLPGYQMVTGIANNEPSLDRIIVAFFVYLTGLVLMMGSDCQKHYVLKYKKGLINDGFFGTTRNPNYLGEVMIYSSYAIMADRWEFWGIMAFVVLSLFLPNMIAKDKSLSQKQGWKDYDSYMFLPKLSSSGLDNLIIYTLIVAICVFVYASGGFIYSYIEGNYIYQTYKVDRICGLVKEMELVQGIINAKDYVVPMIKSYF